MDTIFDLGARGGVVGGVCFRDLGERQGWETEGGGRCGEEAGFDGLQCAVDYCVDRVNYVVDEGLCEGVISWSWGRALCGESRVREECSGSVRSGARRLLSVNLSLQ